MKMKERLKRMAALLLVGIMLLPSGLSTKAAEAAETEKTYSTGLCEHHPEHTGCGYSEGVLGQPCTKEHTGQHDISCGYIPETAPKSCDYVCEICDNSLVYEDTENDTASDTAPGAEPVYIQSIAALPKETLEQTVAAGTALSDIFLPETLEVTDTTGTTVTLTEIIWFSDPTFDSETGGDYVFTPVLPENCIVADGVELPKIMVTVKTNVTRIGGNVWQVGTNDELAKAIADIEKIENTDVILELTADLTSSFAGIAGKNVTVQSTEGNCFSIKAASELVGNITFDNVKVSAGSLFCNGHRIIFTENGQLSATGTLYGGGNGTTVDSTYVVIAADGQVNTGGRDFNIVAGSYKASVRRNTYLEITGNIVTKSGNMITAANARTAYGGDRYEGEDLYVGGNATLIYDVSPTMNGSPNIVGAYNSHVHGNIQLQIKAGKVNGIEGQRGNGEETVVSGSIHIIAGDPAYVNTDHIVRLGYNWDIVGAGEKIMTAGEEFKVQGNVIIDTYENLWGWDRNGTAPSDPPDIMGAHNSEVGGSITINANGSHVEDIVGANDDSVQMNSVITKFSTVVGGDITITANNVELNNAYGEGNLVGLWLENGEHKGNVIVNAAGGSMNRIQANVTKLPDGTATVNITGKPVIRYGVYGIKKTDSQADSVINISSCEAEIPFIYYATEVNIYNASKVTLGGNYKPFYYVYDLNIYGNSSLTTVDQNTQILGDAVINLSTWHAKGYVYVYNTMTSSDSHIYYDNYFAVGYDYKDTENKAQRTVYKSSNDEFINLESGYVSKFYGSVELDSSMVAFMGPVNVSGNWTGGNSELRLPAVKAGENYDGITDGIYIPLNIDGTASGNCGVRTVRADDYTEAVMPAEGDNYITGWAPEGTSVDLPAASTFILLNEDAEEAGYYLKRVEDPADAEAYYMWQVAKEEKYQVLYSFKTQTPYGSLPDTVTALLPVDDNAYLQGETVTAILPKETKVIGPKNSSDDTLGIWTFTGYDADSKVVSEENLQHGADTSDPKLYIIFIGTWVWEELEDIDIVLTPQDMIAYTGGDSLNGDSFPTVRYKIQAADDIDLSAISLNISGQEHKLPEGTCSGDIVILPWLDDIFTLQENASMGMSERNESTKPEMAENDEIAGEYEISIDMESVSCTSESGASVNFICETGTLTVRNVSDPAGVLYEQADIAQPVVMQENMVDTSDGIGIAVIPAGTTYYTNGKEELGILGDNDSDTPQIALLFDDLLPGDNQENTQQLLIDHAAAEGYTLNSSNSQFKYLDLINENDGNSWVSTNDGSKITIYWPCPKGVTADDFTVKVLHFKGLHREYRSDLENQIANSQIEEIKARIDGENIIFELTGNQASGSFSPFAIVWEEKQPETDETEEPEESENPSESDFPSESENPSESDFPSESEKPSESDSSVTESEEVYETGQPSESEVPVNPENESGSNNPTELETDAPKTGDETNIVVWFIVLGTSAFAIVLMLVISSFSKRNRKTKHKK